MKIQIDPDDQEYLLKLRLRQVCDKYSWTTRKIQKLKLNKELDELVQLGMLKIEPEFRKEVVDWVLDNFGREA